MPRYTLTYFPFGGRAEIIRTMFKFGGVEFEDNRINFEQFSQMKSEGSLPFNQLPILDVDGTTIAQSFVIERLAAKASGLAGNGPVEEAQVEMIAQSVHEFDQKWTPVAYMGKQPVKERVEMLKPIFTEDWVKLATYIDKIRAKNGGQFIVGNKISWAEFSVTSMLVKMQECDPTKEFLRNTPRVFKEVDIQVRDAAKEVFESQPLHTVLATFKFKEGRFDEGFKVFSDPNIGLAVTVGHQGQVTLETYRSEEDRDTLMVWQKWSSRRAQEAYLKYRVETDRSFIEAIEPLMASPPTFEHMENRRWKPESGHTVLATFQFKEGKFDEGMKLFADRKIGLPVTVAQQGQVSLETYRCPDNKDLLMVWQKWSSRADQEAYIKYRLEGDRSFIEAVEPLLAIPPTFTHLGNFPWKATVPLTVLATFKFKKGKLDEGMKALANPEMGLPVTMSKKGLLSLQCFQGQEDADTLRVWQKWDSPADREEYVKYRVRDPSLNDALAPLLDSPPTFENLRGVKW